MMISKITKVINSDFVKKHVARTVSDPIFAAKFLVGASVAKDAFEYTTSAVQTMKNKELPERQRKVTATFDGVTGILSCASQLAAGFTILNPKVQKKVGDSLFKGLIQAGEHAAVEKCRAGLAFASSILLTTVLVKRVLVPLFAAPIASYGTEHCLKPQAFEEARESEEPKEAKEMGDVKQQKPENIEETDDEDEDD